MGYGGKKVVINLKKQIMLFILGFIIGAAVGVVMLAVAGGNNDKEK